MSILHPLGKMRYARADALSFRRVRENFRIAMYAFCRIAALKIQFFTVPEMINKTRAAAPYAARGNNFAKLTVGVWNSRDSSSAAIFTNAKEN